MIPTLRRSQILEILQASGLERLPGLAQKMGISESTLRRDLKELALRGEVELLRGGGVRMRRENIERGINEKILLNREEKERIARYAAELIHDNDVVYLDPSSLNCILADYIHANNVKVVTNSFEIIRKLMEKGMNAATGKQKAAAPAPAAAPVPAEEEEQAEETDDDELIAVIAAAVAAAMEQAGEENTTGFVVRSIRRINNAPAWNRAGREEQVYSRM